MVTDVDPDDFIGFQEKSFSLGDIFFGPFIQWDLNDRKGWPVFAHRLEFDAIFPTGTYDSLKQVNAASNIFSFNPYWAVTVFLHPRWNVSWRLHYLWNSTNPDTNVQPGQAIHLNFATSFEVVKGRFHLGVNGYYLQQITDSRLNGTRSQIAGKVSSESDQVPSTSFQIRTCSSLTAISKSKHEIALRERESTSAGSISSKSLLSARFTDCAGR